ncbi:hypothetical protein [Acidovorax sp.]|uniref:hypothetical protein n=1 Tax=Acidovorax sp. TaxID=1872122 RepID=UPI00391B9AA4
MAYFIEVSRKGARLIYSPISKIYGRTLVLFGLTFPRHLQERPQDAQVAMGRLLRTIEDALQENLEAHSRWLELCTTPHEEAVLVDVISSSERVATTASALHGGAGGDGSWPAGGGGGGGNGLLGSSGGNGADGAAVFFQYDAEGQLIDVDAFVLPGTSTWTPPPRVASIKIIACGGGGGGGGCIPSEILAG